jgi:hypothetical protein
LLLTALVLRFSFAARAQRNFAVTALLFAAALGAPLGVYGATRLRHERGVPKTLLAKTRRA